jgi:MFS family permease
LETAATSGPLAPIGSRVEQNALLIVLTLAYTIGYIDRQILNLLVTPIQADLGLSDVQVSLLQGLSFSIGFLVFSPIFGRLAGVMNRRILLMGAMVTWSVATASMAVASSFPALFGLRIAIGAAEAAISPVAFSMIGDSFKQKNMARAFSLFMLAPYIGGGSASLFGGLVYKQASLWTSSAGGIFSGVSAWQTTFLLIGIPSALTAVLLLFVREPRRPQAVRSIGAVSAEKGFARTVRNRPRYYIPFFLGMTLLQVPLYVYSAWLPATAIRVNGASVSEIGTLWGLTSIVCGCAGTLFGPTFGSWLARRGISDAGVRIPLIAVLCMIPCHIVIGIAPSVGILVAAAGTGCFFAAMTLAVAASGLRLVTPSRAFGMATAVYAVSVMIAGIAIAPTLVAMTTEYILGDPSDVGRALSMVCIAVSVASAVMLWIALRPFRDAARLVLAGSPIEKAP